MVRQHPGYSRTEARVAIAAPAATWRFGQFGEPIPKFTTPIEADDRFFR